MFFAPLLKMRDKLTRKRHALTEDVEKPFLEHLDDLRKTLMRIVLTLTVSVVACFVFNPYFFKLIEKPLDDAGLRDPKERNLPASVAAMDTKEQQPTWWRIHATARGMAALEGRQQEIFLEAAAPDAFTRRFAEALLLHHTSEALPEGARAGYVAKATAVLPAADINDVLKYAGELSKAGTTFDLSKPHDVVETEAFAPAESFMLSMKLSMFAGVIVSFPLLFYFLLEFILPGLTGRERKMLFPALSIGFGLFIAGVLFAFLGVIPRALLFFHEYSTELNIKDRWRIGQYISFVTSFCLIFGFAFELPVVVMVMVKLGLLNYSVMSRSRGWAVIIILVASAVLTPTGDAFTMSLLAAPMIVMYEACIWLALLHERRERKREAEEQRQDQARRAALVGVASVQAARSGDAPADQDSTDSADHSGPDEEPSHHLLPGATDTGTGASSQENSGDAASGSSWPHPYHPEKGDDGSEYDQYLKDHAHLYSSGDTHPESIPVEERAEQKEPAPEETPAAAGEPESAAPAPESKAESASGNDSEPPQPAGDSKDTPPSPGPM